MERDSRRDRGQWRGCHTCKDIICDGQEASHLNQTPRNGGLKMGHTYYYYYELDGQTEVHDPAVPSTTACPYLPGQRVNTLWVPMEKSARQRSASVNSLRRDDFRTMNPADRYVTPRPPPATPSAAPAVGSTAHVLRKKSTSMAAGAAAGSTPSPSPSPRLLRRHRAGARSLSPASSWPTWSPRRLFVRRPSPGGRRDVLTAAADGGDDDAEEMAAERKATNESGSWEDEQMRQTIDDEDRPRGDSQQQELRPPLPPRSSSTASLSSLLSRFGRQSSTSTNATNNASAPATAAASSSSAPPSSSPAASQGSRSRDISPESLRRLLVDDGPLESTADSRPESRLAATPAATIPCILEGIDENDDAWSNHDLDDVDDDEHNFAVSAVSAVSENAPFTVLSPPPPPQTTVAAMPVATPPPLPQKPQEQQQQQQQQQQTNEDGVHLSAPEAPVDELVAVVLPAPPTRAPPVVPTLTLSTVSAMASAEDDRIDDNNDDLDNTNANKPHHHQSTFSPSVLAPPSPSPASSPLSSLPSLSSLSFAFAESHGLSSPSETTTDDEDDDDVDDEPDVFARTDDSDHTAVHDPWALSWPLPTDYLSCRDANNRGDHNANDHDHDNGSSSCSSNNGDKADVHDRQHQQHHHLVAAALSGSTATLVPNNSLHAGAGGGANGGSGLHDLVDELGWMATAIQG
ncbi:hypothetical protein SPI_08560 [Niveomyces insectorum RCEF 264]|uniref:Uncharacterized protein n=1 Tax=Niveomyces insectorum RCEF 264 TaxID=1081102 RepID=A0A167N2T0_9HYPO|nr:hypothetical protein SPI_08560 [Niveomyces insectorum RCEF 264]